MESHHPQESKRELEKVERAVEDAYADVREAIVGLRGSVGSGLIPSLEEYLNQWGEQSEVQAQLFVEEDVRLDLGTEIQLIRILQEALTNVRKHARAHRVGVHIGRGEDGVRAVVEDDGCGFDPLNIPRRGRQHFGLLIMKERVESLGGRLEIESAPGRGTKVYVHLPVNGLRRSRDGENAASYSG
jgi:signal transduction histidine kinase